MEIEAERAAVVEKIFVGCSVDGFDIDTDLNVEAGLLHAEGKTAEAGERVDKHAAARGVGHVVILEEWLRGAAR